MKKAEIHTMKKLECPKCKEPLRIYLLANKMYCPECWYSEDMWK